MTTPRIFTVPRNVCWGRGSIAHLTTVQSRRALIITDDVMVKLGVMNRVTTFLRDAGCEVRIFDRVEPEPSIETVNTILIENRAYSPDLIVGVGGGSAIDASKCCRIFLEHPGLKFEDIRYAGSPPKVAIPPFNKTKHIAISSTSGTASDVTNACSITDPRIHRKCPIFSPQIVPDMAIVDPDIADTMPAEVLVDSGMDALSHAIESYISLRANDFSRGNSLHAAKLIIKHIPQSFLKKDPDAKAHVHYAATIAGFGFSNSSTVIGHYLANMVGAAFGLTHGRTCGIVLPYVIKFNSFEAGDLLAEISTAIGYRTDDREGAVEYLIERVCDLRKQLGVPHGFGEAGVSESDYERRIGNFVRGAAGSAVMSANPRRPSVKDLEDLYVACYKGDLDWG